MSKRTAVLVATVGLASGAMADKVLQIDIDALTAEATGAFSDTFTGDLHVFNTAVDPDANDNAEILDVLIDGGAQGTGGAGVDEFAFEMSITFDAGKISSGTVMVAVDQGGSENTYTATIASTTSTAILDIGGIFIIGGLTLDGLFTSPAGTFLGVDISDWGDEQPLNGSFSQIAYQPDNTFTDTDTDVDVFISVPTPAAAGMASLGLLGLAARRRRD